MHIYEVVDEEEIVNTSTQLEAKVTKVKMVEKEEKEEREVEEVEGEYEDELPLDFEDLKEQDDRDWEEFKKSILPHSEPHVPYAKSKAGMGWREYVSSLHSEVDREVAIETEIAKLYALKTVKLFQPKMTLVEARKFTATQEIERQREFKLNVAKAKSGDLSEKKFVRINFRRR